MKAQGSVLVSLRVIALIVFTAVTIYALSAVLVDSERVWQAVLGLPLNLWWQIIGLSLLSYALRFVRWHYFLTLLGFSIPLYRSLEIYLAAFALTLTPGKVGETIRSLYLRPYSVSYPQSLAAFVVERFLDLLVVASMALLFIWSLSTLQLWWVGIFTVLLGFFALLRSDQTRQLIVNILPKLARKYTNQIIQIISFLLRARTLLSVLPITLIAWSVQGIILFLIVQALGYDISVLTLTTLYCVGILAGALSFMPGGLGTTEVTIVLLLVFLGVDSPVAVVAALLTRISTLWLAVSIGLLAMLGLSFRNRQSIESNLIGPNEIR